MSPGLQAVRRHDLRNQLRQVRLEVRLLSEQLEYPCERESVVFVGCSGLVQAICDTIWKLPIRRCRSGLQKLTMAHVASRRSRRIDSFLEATARPLIECDVTMHTFHRGSSVQALMRSLEAHVTCEQVLSLRELRRGVTQHVQLTLEDVRRGDGEGLDERSSKLLSRILEKLTVELSEDDVETAGMIEELWTSPAFKSTYLKRYSTKKREPLSWDEW